MTREAVGVDQLSALPSVRVYNSANQSIVNNTGTFLSFDTVLWDTGQFYDPANPTKLTIQRAGLYIVSTFVEYAANATGTRQNYHYVNNTSYIGGVWLPNCGGTDSCNLACTSIWRFAAGDFVQSYVQQNSGGGLNVFSSTAGNQYGCEFAIAFVSNN